MLNIFKLKLKNKYKNLGFNTKSKIVHSKEFAPAVRS
jgi:hypothetical protein